MRKGKWRWLTAALCVALGGPSCAGLDRRQFSVYTAEPRVDLGELSGTPQQGVWPFRPYDPWMDVVPLRIGQKTLVVEDGVQVGPNALAPGRKVRVVYDLLQSGHGEALRIDIIRASHMNESVDHAP